MLTRFSVEDYISTTTIDFSQNHPVWGGGDIDICYALLDITDHLGVESKLPEGLRADWAPTAKPCDVMDDVLTEYTYEFDFSGEEVVYRYTKNRVRKLYDECLSLCGKDALHINYNFRMYEIGLPHVRIMEGNIDWINRCAAATGGQNIIRHLYMWDVFRRSGKKELIGKFLDYIDGMELKDFAESA